MLKLRLGFLQIFVAFSKNFNLTYEFEVFQKYFFSIWYTVLVRSNFVVGRVDI